VIQFDDVRALCRFYHRIRLLWDDGQLGVKLQDGSYAWFENQCVEDIPYGKRAWVHMRDTPASDGPAGKPMTLTQAMEQFDSGGSVPEEEDEDNY
jgi:hypothetical protein